ncbi:glycosyltransferase, partial [Staphylococcus aureus]|nr:glycosyltransferase [Staphylococcus aureus]
YPDARLVIVGEGHYARALTRRARPLAESVVFTGAVDRARLRDIVAAADVFAMPARTRGAGLDVEGLGIVYLEAQACAVPVVVGVSV